MRIQIEHNQMASEFGDGCTLWASTQERCLSEQGKKYIRVFINYVWVLVSTSEIARTGTLLAAVIRERGGDGQ
jgi:hypothetical protein